MTALGTGPLNLLTDVAGLRVGNASDPALKSGATVVTADAPFVAAVHVMGGAPGTRETDLLAPDKIVPAVDALVLSGGSMYGLDAAAGVVAALREQGRGYVTAGAQAPIVPAAILFDLTNGGDKSWTINPYPDLGRAAYASAGAKFELGTHGAGTGALAGRLKGGLGSASLVLPSGVTVGALVAVNSVGEVVVGDGARFWAAPFEMGAEFGGLGPEPQAPPAEVSFRGKINALGPLAATTIAVVATDAALDKAGLLRMATAAHDGLARAIVPAHTPFDGDLVFAASTGAKPLPIGAEGNRALFALSAAAAHCLSRAVARGVWAARAEPGDVSPCWSAVAG